MSDLNTFLSIIQNPNFVKEIAQQLDDLSEVNNLFQVDRATYYLMTHKTTAHSVWSACLNLKQKIPHNIYVPLYFQPRVHVVPETPPRPLDTFYVYEINYAELPHDRAIVQCRKIPYITEPKLHLLNLSQAKSEINMAEATREAIMRKECSLWLNSLTDSETNRQKDYYPYDMHVRFSLYSLMEILLNIETPDSASEKTANELERMESSGYRLIMDLLLSGKLTLDQFKSIQLPTPRSAPEGQMIFNPHENIDIEALRLYDMIAYHTKAQSDPVHTILFFKRIREMAPQGSTPASLDQLNELLLTMVQSDNFSCETFCQIFLPEKQKIYPIQLIIQRLTSFMRAVHLGTFHVKQLDQALMKNPHLRLPLMDLSDSFYRAVEAGFIPLAPLHDGMNISDLYDSYFLDTDCLPGSYMEKPSFPKKMNRIYETFMSFIVMHPDFESNRLSFIREAIGIFYLMTLRAPRLLKSLDHPEKIETFYNRFCESRHKRDKAYRTYITSISGLEGFHDLLLSRPVQEHIIPRDQWLTMTDDIEPEDINLFFDLTEAQFDDRLTNQQLLDRLLQLHDCSPEDPARVIQQINDYTRGDNNLTPFSPTFRILLECHCNGIDIETIQKLLSPLIPLFRKAGFNVPFSITDCLKDSPEVTDELVRALTSSPYIGLFTELSEEEWLNHILFLKQTTLKIAADHFGAAAGHEMTQTLFASPLRTLCALLLLFLKKWQKNDYMQFLKAYIEMHYYYLTDQFFHYPHLPAPINYYTAETIAQGEAAQQAYANAMRGLPNTMLYAIFQPQPFANVLLSQTLLAYLKQEETSDRAKWNEACLAAYISVPDLDEDDDYDEDDDDDE